MELDIRCSDYSPLHVQDSRAVKALSFSSARGDRLASAKGYQRTREHIQVPSILIYLVDQATPISSDHRLSSRCSFVLALLLFCFNWWRCSDGGFVLLNLIRSTREEARVVWAEFDGVCRVEGVDRRERNGLHGYWSVESVSNVARAVTERCDLRCWGARSLRERSERLGRSTSCEQLRKAVLLQLSQGGFAEASLRSRTSANETLFASKTTAPENQTLNPRPNVLLSEKSGAAGEPLLDLCRGAK